MHLAAPASLTSALSQLWGPLAGRTSGDGLRGFFWPRGHYRDDAEALGARDAVRAAIADERARGGTAR